MRFRPVVLNQDERVNYFVFTYRVWVQHIKERLKLQSCKQRILILQIQRSKQSSTNQESICGLLCVLGKLERTVKRITVALEEKGLIERIGGKRFGYWKVNVGS